MTRRNAPLAASWALTLAALVLAGTTLFFYRQQEQAIAELRSAVERAPRPGGPVPIAPAPSTPLPSAADLSGGAASMADVVARVLPSVVNISISHGGTRSPFGALSGRPDRGGDSLGSGVIVGREGLVVTNHHVVAGGGRILVTLADGREIPANVVGVDPQTDMALLRLEGESLEVTAIPYGDSSQLRQGDVVLAIGNPFGVGQTVTMGIVSATGRADMGIAEYEDFIQTDAAINPGNSGGALISMRGELVGINTAILSRTGGSHGIGFSIPSNMVRPLIDSLLRNGKVIRGWLGVTIQDVTAELATAMHLPVRRGVIVTGLEPGSPAEAAGLRVGDVIEQLENERLGSSAQLRNLVATRGAGSSITLVALRGEERLSVPVQLGERPAVPLAQQLPPSVDRDPSGRPMAPGVPSPGVPGFPFGLPQLGAPSTPAPPMRGHDIGGLRVIDLDARSRAALGIGPDVGAGALVVAIQPGTAGEAAGLQPGDVIVEVNRRAIASAAQLAAELARSGGNAVLLVRRGPASLYVILR